MGLVRQKEKYEGGAEGKQLPSPKNSIKERITKTTGERARLR